MRRGIKKKDHENLSDANIQRVIEALESPSQEKITKRTACEMLNISYNTTRLANIIQEYKDRKEFVRKRKAQNRGKPATNYEIAEAVTSYLQGVTISDIASSLFRSPGFVKAMLEKVGVPDRGTKEEKTRVAYLPDNAIAESFREGEIVWSAQYHKTAVVKKEYDIKYQNSLKGVNTKDYEKEYCSKLYGIYVLENGDWSDSFFPGVSSGGFFAYSLAYDLGKLEHLKEYGVELSRL